jgi:AraC-like DNA-binding protein
VTGQLPIRSEWIYQVRTARQVFYCKVLDADRFDFEGALIWLYDAAPAPTTPQESDTLKDQLKLSALEATLLFHEQHHRRSRQHDCRGAALETSFRVWRRHDDDPRTTYRSWIVSFLEAFDAGHPSSRVERAAQSLRVNFQRPFNLDALASEVGMSRSALTRAFRGVYGMTCGEYQARVRLRWFLERARAVTCPTERLAFDAGYATYHNLSDSLKRRTGLRPSAVRTLNEDQALALTRKQLSLRQVNSAS